jgi:hypothetical protein
MTRALSTTDATEASSAVVGVVEFLAIALPTGTLYLTSGNRAYTFGGNTYSPANGQWGTIGNYNEAADSVPRPMALQLSGVDPVLIGNLIGNHIQWVPITYSLGFTDAAGELWDDPTFIVPMFLGDCTIGLTDGGGTVAISAENLLADMQNRNSGMLQTDGDQQSRFSGDTFFANISSLINKVIFWGQIGPFQVGGEGGGGGSYVDNPPGSDGFLKIPTGDNF